MTKKTKSKNTQLDVAFHFPCPIYLIERPDFLKTVNKVSEESLNKKRKEQEINEIYPVLMSDNFYDDERIQPFSQFVAATAWNILSEQGYDMQNKVTSYMEMWTQEHHKQSSMEQHTHGYGSQIIGFYFLEVPKNSSRVVFYDPRAGKVQIDLPETNSSQATIASKMINFESKPGLMIFTNAWLAHSFTRHESNDPLKFVHFNLTVQMAQSFQESMPAAEII